MDKKKIIILIALVVVGLFVLLIRDRVTYQNNIPLEYKVKILNNYSRFFTVDDCLNRFLSKISNNDSKNTLLLLNDNYEKENDINENNVIKKVDSYGINSRLSYFASKKIYEEKKSENNYTYYVYGEIYEDLLDEINKISDAYFIVNINDENLIFDVMPYNGDLFKEKKHE